MVLGNKFQYYCAAGAVADQMVWLWQVWATDTQKRLKDSDVFGKIGYPPLFSGRKTVAGQIKTGDRISEVQAAANQIFQNAGMIEIAVQFGLPGKEINIRLDVRYFSNDRGFAYLQVQQLAIAAAGRLGGYEKLVVHGNHRNQHRGGDQRVPQAQTQNSLVLAEMMAGFVAKHALCLPAFGRHQAAYSQKIIGFIFIAINRMQKQEK